MKLIIIMIKQNLQVRSYKWECREMRSYQRFALWVRSNCWMARKRGPATQHTHPQTKNTVPIGKPFARRETSAPCNMHSRDGATTRRSRAHMMHVLLSGICFVFFCPHDRRTCPEQSRAARWARIRGCCPRDKQETRRDITCDARKQTHELTPWTSVHILRMWNVQGECRGNAGGMHTHTHDAPNRGRILMRKCRPHICWYSKDVSDDQLRHCYYTCRMD